jgi:zinc transporter
VTRKLNLIAAYDILPDGSARVVNDHWPKPLPGNGALWRWLHCERTDPSFADWSTANLPLAVRAGLMQVETRPQCEMIGDGLLVNLRGMNLNPGQDEDDMVSLRLWLSPGLVVTTRLRRLFAMDELREDVDAGHATTSPVGFASRIADLLTTRIEAASAERDDKTDALEEELLDRHSETIGSDEMQIARLARSVIKLRRYIAPQREALARMANAETPLISAADRYALRELANRTTRTVEELDNIRDRLASLRAHTDSIHAARLGRNGFVLSVVAAVFLPLGFLTGLFGVNVAGMPGASWHWAFAVLSGAMIALGLGLWFLFRWLKWF